MRLGGDIKQMLASISKGLSCLAKIPSQMANLCIHTRLSTKLWEEENLKTFTHLQKTYKSKHILFIRSNPCNPDTRVQKEANSLLKLGTNVSILAWDRDSAHDSTQIQKLENGDIVVNRIGIKALYGVGLKTLFALVKFQIREFCYLLKHRKNIDILHACDFDTALPALCIAKIFGKKLVYDIFDYYVDAYNVPKILKPLIKALDSFVINHCDLCIICSEARIRQIVPANPKNLLIIHNAPDELVAKDKFLLRIKNPDSVKIAYIGSLGRERHIEDLLEVVAEDMNFELHIGGFGILETLVKEYAAKYPNIIYYGKIPYEQTLQIEMRCDVMVALYEVGNNRNHHFAAPNKFYESLMLGKPVVMIKGSGMSDIIREKNLGEVIEFSKDSLRKAIYALKNTDSSEKIARRKKIYKDNYSWTIMQERLLHSYEKMSPIVRKKPIIAFVFGTRPEAIKMCPIANELKKHADVHTLIILSGQHKDMLDPIMKVFGLKADINLNIASSNQTLEEITSKILTRLKKLFSYIAPNIVLVHGDTSTSFGAALSCFYHQIPIAHVEAGLRTYDLHAPFPEEFNRQAIALVADLHFAPTMHAKQNLLKEEAVRRKQENIFVVGNSAIDALRFTLKEDYTHPLLEWVGNSKLILLTAHRRENLGHNLESIFRAIAKLLEHIPNLKVIYPIHPNPLIRASAQKILGNKENLKIVPPLGVVDFHNFLNRADLILTDSGGIQEEAPSLGKPVLVLREVTERIEGVEAGTLKLIGVDSEEIFTQTLRLLSDSIAYADMTNRKNPYGDGKTAQKITQILLKYLDARIRTNKYCAN